MCQPEVLLSNYELFPGMKKVMARIARNATKLHDDIHIVDAMVFSLATNDMTAYELIVIGYFESKIHDIVIK